MIVAWTGHRPDLFRDPAEARASVQSLARELSHEAPNTCFLVGGQRGVDTWAALAAIAAAVPFTLALPFEVETFTRAWEDADRAMLRQTMAHARDVRLVGGYTARNRFLAHSADLLVAVWTRTAGGGTAETVKFAAAFGTPVRETVLPPSPSAATARGRGI